ncbi:MAG: gamma-glutamylcyclotransferase [Proteobacteria bacterium]|nr:gamma-glutamylcyclotransferase [Pseudomonadota bacterium]
MKNEDEKAVPEHDECIVHTHPVPPGELDRYSIDSDPHSEMDIARYVEGQAGDEVVQHVERIKQVVVFGVVYEIWDVVTDKDRYWVITNFTNLYLQNHFPSLDYTLSFHIGLMTRLRDRSNRVDAGDPSPFDEVLRREEQAEEKHDNAIEAEDYQAVGMLLRESLISLISALRRRTDFPEEFERPQDSNFIGWIEVLMNQLCGGGSNKVLRQHLKNTAKETWQLVNWLTHARNADKTASSIAIHSSQIVIGNFIQILERNHSGKIDQCPVCKSRKMRTHFDITIPPDGDYYMSCGICDWNSHPENHAE